MTTETTCPGCAFALADASAPCPECGARPAPTDATYADAANGDLATVLGAVEDFACRYVAFASPAQPVALALWSAHTWTAGAAAQTPYLHVTSPEKRSGKSRLLDVLELVCREPWRCILPTEAVLFRRIERDGPTLLLDEIDAVFRKGGARDDGTEALRGLLNASNRRGQRVDRCQAAGRNVELVSFDVYCPKALAGIGALPDTIADRCIPIRLRRRAPGEHVGRFRHKHAEPLAAPIREGFAAWAAVALDTLGDSDPALPGELNDRAQDCWETLLAVADLAGGDWPRRARTAAVALAATDTTDDTLGVRLLADVRDVLGGRDRVATDELLSALNGSDESPWGDFRGRPLVARDLARILRPYDIAARKIRIGGRSVRGYLAEDLADAFARYVSPPPPEGPLSGTCGTVLVAPACGVPRVPLVPPSGRGGDRPGGPLEGEAGEAETGSLFALGTAGDPGEKYRLL